MIRLRALFEQDNGREFFTPQGIAGLGINDSELFKNIVRTEVDYLKMFVEFLKSKGVKASVSESGQLVIDYDIEIVEEPIETRRPTREEVLEDPGFLEWLIENGYDPLSIPEDILDQLIAEYARTHPVYEGGGIDIRRYPSMRQLLE